MFEDNDRNSSSFSDGGEERKPRKSISVAGIIALAVCCSLLGGIVGAAGSQAFIAQKREPSANVEVQDAPAADAPEGEIAAEPTEAPSPAPTAEPKASAAPYSAAASESSGAQMTPAEVYAGCVDSTVGITTSITTNYWGYRSTSAASGSGFILTEDGYILTNFHVIEDSSSVTVTTYDNKSYPATVVGYDSGNDIAVLKIDATGLHPVTLGSSDSLRVGDTVLAIGNPLGELTFSLTVGVVSALNREITLSSGASMDLIQTDTAINSGNSGGALFNLYGEVVGITNAKYSGSYMSSSASIDNIGFAIPIDQVRGIVESIVNTGAVVKPYIGVMVVTVSSEMQSYNFPQGAAVKQISDGSPAETAGLRVNDIITAVNGVEITTSSELKNAVGRCAPGDTMVLTVYRQEEGYLEITLTVGEQAVTAESFDQRQQSDGYGYGYGNGNGYGFGFGGNPFGNG